MSSFILTEQQLLIMREREITKWYEAKPLTIDSNMTRGRINIIDELLEKVRQKQWE